MAALSIAPASRDDAAIGSLVESYARRVAAFPPGTCPIAVHVSVLEAGMAQTCGKCVPCRDGLPQLAGMLKGILACEADESILASARALAETIRDTADCAIGYEAANCVLRGFDAFEREYANHIASRECGADIGQTLPCETLCPAHVDIPAYISCVAEGDYAGAIKTIRKDNPFPTACAFVCEHPCEERCRRQIIDAPVNIRGIKKFAVDQLAADKVEVPERAASTGRSIAVIGGGPSGLTCAYFAALMGHDVTVYEMRGELGGMMRYGIPAYRLPRERLDEDIRAILDVGGISVRFGEKVDTASMAEIAKTHDAVYVSIGAQAGKTLHLEGADAEGVMSAVQLLGAIGEGETPDFSGEHVVVIGGGNVAMDCARTAVRAGAEDVTVVYRRRREDMTALAEEVDSAVAEGVEVDMLRSPVSIEVDGNGHCTALITQPQMIGPEKGRRPAPLAADKPTVRIPADIILIAVGQAIQSKPFEEFGMAAERGCFQADDALRSESFDNVFVGGDCQTGPATVIRAIAAGKVAARNIDEHLGFHHKLACDTPTPEPHQNVRTPMGRVNILERRARERAADWAAVETEMSLEEARQECSRCLRCDHFGCGSMDEGRVRYA